MCPTTRCRSQVDDRHKIRDPYGTEVGDMEAFANTLLKTRVAGLFRTPEGLQGHAAQLQQELNRLAKVKDPSKTTKAVEQSKLIRYALQKSKKAAAENNFPFDLWQSNIHYL